MNKRELTKIALVVALALSAGQAYASSSITTSLQLGGGTFSPSNNVAINVNSTATQYAAYAGHFQGDKVFFTNNGDPKFYYGTKAKGVVISNTPAATDNAPSGWTSM